MMRTRMMQSQTRGQQVHPGLVDWRGVGGGGITLMQMPQPIHRDSEIQAILLCGVTSIHSLPATNIQMPLEPQTTVLPQRVRRAVAPTHADHRAALLALLTALLGLAFVMVDDGNPGVFIRHGGGWDAGCWHLRSCTRKGPQPFIWLIIVIFFC